MRSNLLSAALLYGVLSTTIVVAQTFSPISPSPTGPGQVAQAPAGPTLPVGSESSSIVESSAGASASSSAGEMPKPALKSGSSNTHADTPEPSGKPSGKNNNTGAIAGGVVGGVVLLIIVGALIFFLRRKKRAHDPFGSMEKSRKPSSTLPRSLMVY